jgi:hypothetical protein
MVGGLIPSIGSRKKSVTITYEKRSLSLAPQTAEVRKNNWVGARVAKGDGL